MKVFLFLALAATKVHNLEISSGPKQKLGAFQALEE